jgi:LCP family protein required for cell wall assembly
VRRWLLIALGAVVVLAGVLLGAAWWQANDVLAQLHAGPKGAVVNAVRPELHKRAARELVKPPPEPHAQTILVIGSDHRWDGGRHNARSDTIMLARIEPSRHRIALLSIPRDLYVAIPGYGHDRINEAFHHGGERLLTRVVRETFGVEIDHFVEVDFHGFKDLVSALGGVYLPVDQRYFNQNVGTPGTNYANIDLQPGYQKLDGTQALAFARFRHTDNDLVRAARQQLLIRTAAHQALAGGWDPFRIRRLAYAFAKATTSDISSLGEVLALAQAVRDTPASSIARLTVQASDVVLYGADYLQASDAQLRATVRAWLGAAQPRRAVTPAHTHRAIAAAATQQVQLAANTQAASLLAGVRDGIRTCAPTRLPFGFWWPSGAARRYALAGHPAIAL